MSNQTVRLMQKATRLIAVFLLSLLSVSAHVERVFKASDGYRAPLFTVGNAKGSIGLSELEGDYVLVNFWSSADAPSRMAAFDYDRYFSTSESKIRFLSVNLDQSPELFRAVVEADSLDASHQYHATGSSAEELIRDYHLRGNLTSFLVDPQGRIVATDPTVETLSKV